MTKFKITYPLFIKIFSWIAPILPISLFLLWFYNDVLHGDNITQELIALFLDVTILGFWSVGGIFSFFVYNIRIIVSDYDVDIFYFTVLKRTIKREFVEFYATPYYRFVRFYIYDIEKAQLISFDKEIDSKAFIAYLKSHNQITIFDTLDYLSTHLEKIHPDYKQGITGFKTY